MSCTVALFYKVPTIASAIKLTDSLFEPIATSFHCSLTLGLDHNLLADVPAHRQTPQFDDGLRSYTIVEGKSRRFVEFELN